MARRSGFISAMAQIQRDAERRRAAQTRERAQFERHLQRERAAQLRARAAHDRDAARQYAQARADEAAQATAEVDARVAELEGILAATLDVDDFLDLETLKTAPTMPALDLGRLGDPPVAPQLEQFLPAAPSGAGRLFGGANRHREESARAQVAFEAAMTTHREAQRRWENAAETARRTHQSRLDQLGAEHRQQVAGVEDLQRGLQQRRPEAVVGYLDLVLGNAAYPDGFPHSWLLAYTPESRQLLVDYTLPNVDVVPTDRAFKHDKASDTLKPMPRNQTQIRALYASIVTQTALRVVHEIVESDRSGFVQSLVLNAYVETVNRATGRPTRVCLIALSVSRARFEELDLRAVEPAACLQHLEASVSRNPAAGTAVEPRGSFQSLDQRYVSATDGHEDVEPPSPAPPPPPPAPRHVPPQPTAGPAARPTPAGRTGGRPPGVALFSGQNVALQGPLLEVAVLDPSGRDLSVVLLAADGRTRSDTDFIFFNQPASADGSVLLHGGPDPSAASIDLSAVAADCQRIVLLVSSGDSPCPPTTITVADPLAEPDEYHFVAGDGGVTALLLAEVYRRPTGWRLRAVGQGYTDGLAGLARDFGVQV